MATDERNIGNTGLIDVGEVPTEFDDEFTVDRGSGEGAGPGEDVDAQAPTIAELKDRFAAFFIDASCLYVLYWLLSIPYRAIALGSAEGPVPVLGTHGAVFHGIFLLLAFLWFALFEFAIGASPGKRLCRLTVRKNDGSPLTLGAAIIRNLLRPLDLLLAPLLIPAACMEWTVWHRRLGDMAAASLVIRTLGRPPRRFAISLDIVSSASRRAIAFALDLVLLSGLAFGYALLLSPRQPITSMLLVVCAPFLLLAYFVLPEWLLHTTPGKWILGLVICHEDGTACSLSTATVRNLWRIFDLNPFGFFTSLINIRKQRPGDSAAGSLVIVASREWKGIIALVVSLLLATAILYAGMQNRQSLLHSDFEVNFLPSLDLRGGAPTKAELLDANLGIREFWFAAGTPDSIRKPSIFQPGENLYMVFDIGGFKQVNGEIWIQEDVDVRYPDGTLGLKLENINDIRQRVDGKGLIRFENNIALPATAAAGRYTVTITLRDKNARREVKEQRFFYITPPEEGGPAQPPPAVAPAPEAEGTAAGQAPPGPDTAQEPAPEPEPQDSPAEEVEEE